MRVLLMAVLIAGLAVAACGKKGDPIRPGAETETETGAATEAEEKEE